MKPEIVIINCYGFMIDSYELHGLHGLHVHVGRKYTPCVEAWSNHVWS